MYVFKIHHWLILVCTLTVVNLPIGAHTLDKTTAQIILRDGQIELKLIVNMPHLVSSLQNSQAWLLGDIDKVMPEQLSQREQEQFIKNALKQKTNLIVNGETVRFERVTFHNNKETNHGEIIFQAQHTFTQVKELSISFHKSLGQVHMNVIKPQYRLLEAGEATHIRF